MMDCHRDNALPTPCLHVVLPIDASLYSTRVEYGQPIHAYVCTVTYIISTPHLRFSIHLIPINVYRDTKLGFYCYVLSIPLNLLQYNQCLAIAHPHRRSRNIYHDLTRTPLLEYRLYVPPSLRHEHTSRPSRRQTISCGVSLVLNSEYTRR